MCMSTVGLGEQVGVVEVAVRGDLLRISVKMHVVTLTAAAHDTRRVRRRAGLIRLYLNNKKVTVCVTHP